MGNPWEDISLEDYESHMSLDFKKGIKSYKDREELYTDISLI